LPTARSRMKIADQIVVAAAPGAAGPTTSQ
jgi:hypothetical protein